MVIDGGWVVLPRINQAVYAVQTRIPVMTLAAAYVNDSVLVIAMRCASTDGAGQRNRSRPDCD